MTVLELIEKLRHLADAGHGDAIVCVPDYDECSCSGDMYAVVSVEAAAYQAIVPNDAENGDPVVLIT